MAVSRWLAIAWLFAGCYRPMAPLVTAADRHAWVERLGVRTAPAPETCPAGGDEGALIRLAIARSAEVAAFEAEARWLDASAEASYAPAPQLRVNNLRADQFAADEPRFEVGLRVPFARPGTLDAKADELRQEALAVRARAEEEARELTLELRLALVRHHGWKGLASLAVDERALAQAEVARLRLGAASRQVSATELALAEVALLEAEGQVSRAAGEAARWLAVIQAAIGPCALDEAPPDSWPRADPGEREALVRDALSERPSLKLYAAESGRAVARTWEARSLAWPWLDFAQFGYELTHPAAPDTWTFSLAIDLPIGAWDGAHAEAAVLEERALREVAQKEAARIVAEVDAALAEWRSGLEAVAVVERIAQAFDGLAELKRAAAQGLADHDDVQRIERDLLRLQRRRIEALIALGEARARLLAAIAR